MLYIFVHIISIVHIRLAYETHKSNFCLLPNIDECYQWQYFLNTSCICTDRSFCNGGIFLCLELFLASVQFRQIGHQSVELVPIFLGPQSSIPVTCVSEVYQQVGQQAYRVVVMNAQYEMKIYTVASARLFRMFN